MGVPAACSDGIAGQAGEDGVGDDGGLPLEIGCSTGDKTETHTMAPIVTSFQDCHSLSDMVVVAGAGMMCAVKLKDLDDAGLRFVVGARQVKPPQTAPTSSIGVAPRSPTDSPPTRSPPGTQDTSNSPGMFALKRCGIPSSTRRHGGRSGSAPTRGPCAAPGPSHCKSRGLQDRTGISLQKLLKTLRHLLDGCA